MIRLRPALWPTLISLPIFVVSLGLGIWQMERRAWKQRHPASHRGQPGGGADHPRRAAARRSAAPGVRPREGGGHVPERQGVLPRRPQPQEQGRPAGRDAAAHRRRPHRAVQPRLGPAGAEGSGQARPGPGRRPRRSHRHRAAQPGAPPVRARERARQERLVPCRRAADAQHGRRQARSRSSTPSSSTPMPRPTRAACRSAARRGSTSPTTICSTPSPGS